MGLPDKKKKSFLKTRFPISPEINMLQYHGGYVDINECQNGCGSDTQASVVVNTRLSVEEHKLSKRRALKVTFNG